MNYYSKKNRYILTFILFLALAISGCNKKTIEAQTNCEYTKDGVMCQVDVSSIHGGPHFLDFQVPPHIKEVSISAETSVEQGTIDIWIEDSGQKIVKTTVKPGQFSKLNGLTKIKKGQDGFIFGYPGFVLHLEPHRSFFSKSAENIKIIVRYSLYSKDVNIAIKALQNGNFKKANTYFKKACDSDNLDGCFGLGLLYVNGQGIEQNYLKAKTYFSKACDGGHTEGCSNLGISYANGYGVKQDYLKAEIYYTKACDANNINGCFGLGLLYANGEGVEQNYPKAKTYYKKACDGGHIEGCQKYSILNKKKY